MNAIARQIDRRLNELPAPKAAELGQLIVELLSLAAPEVAPDPPQPIDTDERRRRGLAALNFIAARGGIVGIENPMAWQRDSRAERPLPGRES